jgi:hypothetical protein
MKKYISLIIGLIISLSSFSQSPEKISYQAVIRNASGDLIKNSSIGFKISILQSSASGSPVYVETQTPVTNENGLITLEIGGGAAITGLFSSISWGDGPFYLKTEADPNGGTNYTVTGTTQILSVPYALYSKTTSNIFSSDLLVNSLTVGRGNGSIATNAAFGNHALYVNTTGYSNVAIGSYALYKDKIGHNSVAIGDSALYNNQTSWIPYFHNYSIHGLYNTAVGSKSMFLNSTGQSNTATGYQALYSNTTGDWNTATGAQALYSNSTGFGNVATGYQALYSSSLGYRNTAIGHQALYTNKEGNDNIAIGFMSLFLNTSGNGNSAIGESSLYSNTTGLSNIAIGTMTLYKNTTGYENTSIGNNTLFENTSGWGNIAIGGLPKNTIGVRNISIGLGSLQTNVTGNENIAIGTAADVISENLNNAIAIGSGAVVNASNKIRLGNTDVTVIEGQVAFTSASDRRLKKNIKDLNTGLDLITKLRPVEFQMNNGDNRINYGFVAQDIEKLIGPDNSILTIGGDADRTLGLRYTDFIAPMVKAIQEQQETIKEQQKEIDELKLLVKSLIKN